MRSERLDFYRKRVGELAYQRLLLTRQLEQLDRQIASYEAAIEAADQIRRDIETEAAVQAAKETEKTCQSS